MADRSCWRAASETIHHAQPALHILSHPQHTTPTPWLLHGFQWYCQRYLKRHFHAVRLLREPPVLAAEQPLVVYLNHPSWWDPLICLEIARHYFPTRQNFAPIDAVMLGRYSFMRRLGFFGVEQGSTRGAAGFLRSSQAILQQPGTSLWLTPQGRFADPRERPARFAAGLPHLARRVPHAVYLPLALEYPFWSESTPEALAHFGTPARDPEDLEPALVAAQEALATAAQQREAAPFRTLLSGRAGEGGVYERWRRLRARWRGETFRREHCGGSAP